MSNCQDYTNLFINQFIQTLAQLSAVIVSGSLAVPAYSYYLKSYTKSYTKPFSVNVNDDENLDEDENLDDTVLLNADGEDIVSETESDSNSDINETREIIDSETLIDH